MEENNQGQVTANEWETGGNQKNGGKKVITVVMLLVLLLVFGAIATWYFLIFNSANPKVAFYNNLSKVGKNTSALLEKTVTTQNYMYDKDKVIEAGIRFSGSIETDGYDPSIELINEILNGEEIYFKEQIDLENDEIYAYLELNENNRKAISGEIYINKDSIIVALKDTIKEQLYMNRNEVPSNMEELNNLIDSLFDLTITDNDYSKYYDLIAKVIKENIKDDQFKKASETITIDGKDVKCEKTSLIMPKEQPKQILIKILEELKNDEDIKKIPETIDILEEQIEMLKEEELNLAITINLYNSGSNVVRMDVIATAYVEDDEIKLSVLADFSKENKIDIEFKMESQESQAAYTVKLNIESVNNKVTAVLDFGSAVGIKVALVSENLNDNESKLVLTMEQEREEMLSIELKNKLIKNSKDEYKVESNIIFDIVTDAYYEESVYGEINLDLEIANIDRVNKLKINSTDIDLFNDTMPEDILTKLEDKINSLNIFNKITDLMGY